MLGVAGRTESQVGKSGELLKPTVKGFALGDMVHWEGLCQKSGQEGAEDSVARWEPDGKGRLAGFGSKH